MGRRSRTTRRAAFAAALVGAGVLVSSAASAFTPPKGDRAAIAFYTRRAEAYARVPGVRIVETGFLFLRRSTGTSVSYSWGRSPSPGYRAAKVTVDAQLADGQVVAYLARFEAPKIRHLRVLMAGSDVYTSTTRCWRKSPPSGSPWGTGDRYVFNDGGALFSPLSRSGASTSVTFTYSWTKGSTATETDTFAAGKPGPVQVSIIVRGSESLSIHKSITPLRTAPALPVPPAPLIPRPKPLCK